jgi:hypothetical protein
LDTADAAVFGEVADNEAFYVVDGWDFAFFGCDFEADEDCFFELTNAFTGDTEKLADLFERFFAIKKTKTTRDDFALAVLVDDFQDVLDG